MGDSGEVQRIQRDIAKLIPMVESAMEDLEEGLDDVKYLPKGHFTMDEGDKYTKIFKSMFKDHKSLNDQVSALRKTWHKVVNTDSDISAVMDLGPEDAIDVDALTNVQYTNVLREELKKLLAEDGEDEQARQMTLRNAEKFKQFETKLASKIKLNNPPETQIEQNDANIAGAMETGIMCIEAHISTKDPITLLEIQGVNLSPSAAINHFENDPVRNKHCGHAYDRISIGQYMEQQKARKEQPKCPVSMCTNKRVLKLVDMQDFPELFDQRQ